MNRVVCSGLNIANDFGASSPNTICRIVMIRKATGSAIPCANSGLTFIPTSSMKVIIIFETTGSPIQPKARLDNVIPNCVAARYASR